MISPEKHAAHKAEFVNYPFWLAVSNWREGRANGKKISFDFLRQSCNAAQTF
jgi:hypothetical protein